MEEPQYDAAPYNCAPSGYYGPEWFSGDVFVGAGPWIHGSTFGRHEGANPGCVIGRRVVRVAAGGAFEYITGYSNPENGLVADLLVRTAAVSGRAPTFGGNVAAESKVLPGRR